MMKFIGIIPARYASTRFPGKPLALLGGKPIIQHVYEQVKRCIDDVWVATDDQRIIDVVSAFGGKAIMTSDSHKSGTDRIHEAADLVKTDADVIINIQGDEPFIAKEQIETICQCFDDSRTQIATLAKPFEKDIFLFDTYVAGTTHIEGIEELEPHLNNDDRLEFFREPDNRYDKQAIVIKTVDGVKIGYVPKQDNVIFARLMDAGKLLFGKITSKEKKGSWVKIYIKVFLHE